MGERERDRDSFLCKEDKMALEVDSPGIVGDGRPRKQHSERIVRTKIMYTHGIDQNPL